MIFYNFIKLILRFAINIFFDDVEIHNIKNIPKEGPILIASNHPSSIMDALVLGVKIPRKIHYIGHSGLFSNLISKKFLYAMGIIPVYRRFDNPDNMNKNDDMFRTAFAILEEGKCIGIFPEGTSQTDRKVLKLKTGTARIALGAENQNNFTLGVTIIPLGLYFTARHQFRSNVLLNVGKPIIVSEFKEDYLTDEYKGVHLLTDKISLELGKLTVNIQKEDLNDFVIDLEKIYRTPLKNTLEEDEIHISGDEIFKDMFLTKHLADAVSYYLENDPEKASELRHDVKYYRMKIDRLNLHDSFLQSDIKKSKVTKRSWKIAVWSIVGFPLWIAGVITNYPPYRFAEYVGKKIGYDQTKTSSALLIGGGIGFLAYYFLETLLIWNFYTPVIGLIFLACLPFLGFGALAYRKKVKYRWKIWQFSLTLLTNRHIVKKLKLERKSIIRRLDEFKDDYLKVMGGSE